MYPLPELPAAPSSPPRKSKSRTNRALLQNKQLRGRWRQRFAYDFNKIQHVWET